MVHPFIYTILITIFQTLMNVLKILFASVPSPETDPPKHYMNSVMDKGHFLSRFHTFPDTILKMLAC